MKQASLIAAISMAVLIFVDIFGFWVGYWALNILFLLKILAKCGVGYFFIRLYKTQK